MCMYCEYKHEILMKHEKTGDFHVGDKKFLHCSNKPGNFTLNKLPLYTAYHYWIQTKVTVSEFSQNHHNCVLFRQENNRISSFTFVPHPIERGWNEWTTRLKEPIISTTFNKYFMSLVVVCSRLRAYNENVIL